MPQPPFFRNLSAYRHPAKVDRTQIYLVLNSPIRYAIAKESSTNTTEGKGERRRHSDPLLRNALVMFAYRISSTFLRLRLKKPWEIYTILEYMNDDSMLISSLFYSHKNYVLLINCLIKNIFQLIKHDRA